MFAICLSVPIVFSTGISNFLESSAPELALALNPFHGDAKVNVISRQLSESTSADDLIVIRAQAQELVSIAPIDARAFSLVGETYLRTQDDDVARRYFETALQFSKTEISALQRTYGFMLQDGEISEALDRLDLILRRWPGQFEPLVPSMPYVLNTSEGYSKALDLLANQPPWRLQFLRALNRDSDSLNLLNRILLDLHAVEGQSDPTEVATAMYSLIREKRYDSAHRLFLITQSDADRDNNGYVFNSAFDLKPSNRPFDWSISDNAAAQIKWVETGLGQTGQMRIRFLGKPAKSIGIRQYVRLPPGSYEFLVQFSGAGLQLPKGLFVELRCRDPWSKIARIAIPKGTSVNQSRSISFQVDRDSCGIFWIWLTTDLIAESFRYRYNGTLEVHEIRIEKQHDG